MNYVLGDAASDYYDSLMPGAVDPLKAAKAWHESLYTAPKGDAPKEDKMLTYALGGVAVLGLLYMLSK